METSVPKYLPDNVIQQILDQADFLTNIRASKVSTKFSQITFSNKWNGRVTAKKHWLSKQEFYTKIALVAGRVSYLWLPYLQLRPSEIDVLESLPIFPRLKKLHIFYFGDASHRTHFPPVFQEKFPVLQSLIVDFRSSGAIIATQDAMKLWKDTLTDIDADIPFLEDNDPPDGDVILWAAKLRSFRFYHFYRDVPPALVNQYLLKAAEHQKVEVFQSDGIDHVTRKIPILPHFAQLHSLVELRIDPKNIDELLPHLISLPNLKALDLEFQQGTSEAMANFFRLAICRLQILTLRQEWLERNSWLTDDAVFSALSVSRSTANLRSFSAYLRTASMNSSQMQQILSLEKLEFLTIVQETGSTEELWPLIQTVPTERPFQLITLVSNDRSLESSADEQVTVLQNHLANKSCILISKNKPNPWSVLSTKQQETLMHAPNFKYQVYWNTWLVHANIDGCF